METEDLAKDSGTLTRRRKGVIALQNIVMRGSNASDIIRLISEPFQLVDRNHNLVTAGEIWDEIGLPFQRIL